MHLNDNWNRDDNSHYTVLQPMRIDSRNFRPRKRPRMPTRTEINDHLRLIANKSINIRTSLRVQTLINHEYNEKLNQLRQVEEETQEFGYSDSSTSDEEEQYDCYGFVYTRIMTRRKKYKLVKN